MKPQKETNSEDNKLDFLKWGIVAILLVGGLYAHYHFASVPMPIRIIAWIGLAGVVAAIAFQTAYGAKIVGFGTASRTELRKVVWPSRQETVQTTMLVIAMVLIAGFVLWGVDNVLLWVVGLLTGQRG